jgi:hypothetical protein
MKVYLSVITDEHFVVSYSASITDSLVGIKEQEVGRSQELAPTMLKECVLEKEEKELLEEEELDKLF